LCGSGLTLLPARTFVFAISLLLERRLVVLHSQQVPADMNFT